MSGGLDLATLRALALGVVSPTQAARLLPGRDADVLAWLRASGLVRPAPWGGGAVVVLADVRAALSRAESVAPDAAPPLFTLSAVGGR